MKDGGDKDEHDEGKEIKTRMMKEGGDKDKNDRGDNGEHGKPGGGRG